MLDEESRQRVTLHQEGLVLANVGNAGARSASEIAECQIDGIANALIRIQGAERTASFVFALSDRVAGGVRDVTDYLPQFRSGESEPLPPPAPSPIGRNQRVPDFAYGFLCGLGAMLAVTCLAMGRF